MSEPKKFPFKEIKIYFLIFIFTIATLSPTKIIFADPVRTKGSSRGKETTPPYPFSSTVIKGLKVFPDHPLQFHFILDIADEHYSRKDKEHNRLLLKTSRKLIKYFLATLAVPEQDMWVNLSPDEPDRIIPKAFGETEMGKDLLDQDFVLKKITASLMSPDNKTGRQFWRRMHKKMAHKGESHPHIANTFNKIWIVPEKAVVYENAETNTAFVIESKLKVMTEEDYISTMTPDSDKYSIENQKKGIPATDVIRKLIIPEIEREVNEGKHFVPLRQMYHSMILGAWYKKNLRESLLGQIYMNQNKIQGIDIKDKHAKQKIYAQYLTTFEKGVYDHIRKEYDSKSQKVVFKKYFSGGIIAGKKLEEVYTEAYQTEVVSPDLAVASSVTIGANLSLIDGEDNLENQNIDELAADELITMLITSLGISEGRIARKYRNFDNKKIKIVQHRSMFKGYPTEEFFASTRSHELSPPLEDFDPSLFFQVGKILVIKEKILNNLNKQDRDKIEKYPYLIRYNKDYRSLNQGWFYGTPSMLNIAAGMLMHEEELKKTSFIDLGAGESGILSLIAKKLGALEIICIEQDEKSIVELKNSFTNNGYASPKDYLVYEENASYIKNIPTNYPVFLVSNLPFLGALDFHGNVPPLENILTILQHKHLAIMGGEDNADIILKEIVEKNSGSLSNNLMFTEQGIVIDTGIAKFNDSAILVDSQATSSKRAKDGGIDLKQMASHVQTQGQKINFKKFLVNLPCADANDDESCITKRIKGVALMDLSVLHEFKP